MTRVSRLAPSHRAFSRAGLTGHHDTSNRQRLERPAGVPVGERLTGRHAARKKPPTAEGHPLVDG